MSTTSQAHATGSIPQQASQGHALFAAKNISKHVGLRMEHDVEWRAVHSHIVVKPSAQSVLIHGVHTARTTAIMAFPQL